MPVEQSLVTLYANLSKQFACYDCSVPNWETQSLIYYPQFDLSVAACFPNSTGCKINQFYNPASKKCKSCEDHYPNCAICNQNECLGCFDGYYLHPQVFDYSTGTYKSLCVFDICPLNTCKDPFSKKCVPSSFSNCRICTQNQFKQQKCEDCSNANNTNSSGECSLQETSFSYRYTINEKGERVYNRFILANKTAVFTDDPPGLNYDPPYIRNNGETIFNPLNLLQMAFLKFINEIQTDGIVEVKSNLIVYMGKGDYFFFYCSKESTFILQTQEGSSLYNYCYDVLNTKWIINDNTEITIQAMDCSMREEILQMYGIPPRMYSIYYKIFDENCVNLTASEDQRPIIYVNDPYTFFNVTSKLTVKNIRFSGINQMASTSKKNFGAIPKKLCEPDSQNQTGQTLKLKKPEGRQIPFEYECKDQNYEAPFLPPDDGISSQQCIKNEFAQFNNIQKSTLGCSGSLTAKNYHKLDENTHLQAYRRRALFNLYGFSQQWTRREGPPELVIINCDFEYFLNDYESLIYVETQTYWKYQAKILVANQERYRSLDQSLPNFVNQTKEFYFVNGMDRGAIITITDSNFGISRFCKGLIIYRPAYFEKQMRSFTNFTHIFMTDPGMQYNNSQIVIKNSKFANLNAFTKVSALAAYGGIIPTLTIDKDVINTFTVPAFIHKGIVLNIEDFKGRVEIVDCEFEKNMHFIPDIYYKFQSSSATGNHQAFQDNILTHEYQLRKCLPDEGIDDFFFGKGFSQDDDLDSFFDRFERLGVIYISRNQKEIIIRDNTFKNNIGTFGGAITINSPNWDKGESYVVIRNNKFTGNMAYFSGNALYIRNTLPKTKVETHYCGGADVSGNTFENNAGLKIHNGGAISAVCEYLTDSKYDDFSDSSSQDVSEMTQDDIDKAHKRLGLISNPDMLPLQVKKYELCIKDNEFIENFSGMKGAAIYIKQFPNVVIESCLFFKNGPVYTAIEQQYSPYVNYLSQGQAITFRDQLCPEEFQYLEKCYNTKNEFPLWSRVKGVVYAEFCQEDNCQNSKRPQRLTISNSKFSKNDAGPLLDVNLINQNSDPIASQIFLKGGMINLIQNCQFLDNSMKGDVYFPSILASKLANYFPLGYFAKSHSSMIVVQINPSIMKNFSTINTTIINSLFTRNKNHQVIGLTSGSTYQGSLIRYINLGSDQTKYLAVLHLKDNDFRENQFFGHSSSLISVSNVLVKIYSCSFSKNGFIGTRKTIISQTDFNAQSKIGSKVLYFKEYETFEWQEYGAIAIYGTMAFAYQNQTHEIFNNTFELSSSKLGTAIYISISYQDIYIKGNTFNHLFADVGGAVLYSEGTQKRSTILMEKSNISHIYSVESGPLFITTYQPVQSLILRNSSFDHTYGYQGQAITVISAQKVYIENVNFTRTPLGIQNSSIIQYAMTYVRKSKADLYDSFYQEDLENSLRNQFHGLIGILTTSNEMNITFAGEIFQNSYLQYSELINCYFSNAFGVKYSVISIVSSKVRIFNDPLGSKFNGFYGNIALDRGIIGAEGRSQIIGTNLVFSDNWSKNMASTFYSSSSEIILENCTFINNTANGVGSIVLEADSIFSCNYCKFINNKGNDSSTIFANSNQFKYFKLTNSAFENNTSVANLINMFQSTGIFENVTFLNNIASKVNNGITLISSSLTAKNITVRYDSPEFINRLDYDVDTGFFNLNYRSLLSIENARFTNCRGAIAGVLYATGSSRVELSQGTVIESSFSQMGNTLFLSLAESIQVRGAVFRDNRLTDLYIEKTYAKIENSVFTGSQAESIRVVSSQIDIINNTFADGINYNVDGKAINCKCLNGSIINNTFKSLGSARGGAIYLSSDVSQGFSAALTFVNNKFIDNHAQHGGAIYINDVVQLKISKNLFIGNKASIIEPASELTKTIQNKGYGGAIYYTCLNDVLKAQNIQCKVQITESNIFKNNQAQNDGGAILWVTYPYEDDGTNYFQNNTASYGQDIATYPQSLLVEFLDNGDYLQPYKQEPHTNLTQSNKWLRRQLQSNSLLSSIPVLAPGIPFTFNAYILDQNGNVYKTDSQSKAILKAKSSSNITSYDKSRVVVYNEEVVAKEGIFKFVNATVMAFPGSNVSLKLEIQGIQTFGNSLSFLEQPLQLNVSLRKCASGEQLQADFSCKTCAPGTYLYEIPEKEMYCKECSKHAVCFGRNLVAPQPEYWRSDNTSENFMKCLNPKVCLGGNETCPTGNCAEGYEGILCQKCTESYYKSEQFKCSKCPDNQINAIQIIFVGIGAIIIVVLLVRSSLNSATKRKPLYSVYLRIFANHIQIVGAISNIDYNWPEAIKEFQDGKQQISATTDRLFSFDCLLMNTVNFSSDGNDNEGFPIYYQKLLFYGVLPLLLAVVDFIFWFVYCTFKEKSYSQMKSKFISTLVVLFFLVHPTITKTMFLQLNCIQVDDNLRLQANLESICYKGQHMFFLLAIVVPSILIWTFGILVFVIILLAKNKKTFSLMQNKEVTQDEYNAIMNLKMKYGFLFSGYIIQSFYWEIVIVVRKIIIIMATVFFSSFSTDLQVLLILLIIIISMFIQVKFAPYYTSTLNQMENYSLQVCAVTLYSGIFYVTGRHYNYMENDGLNWFFFFCVIIPNIIFFFYWLYMIRIELLKEFHKMNKPVLFRLFSCMTMKYFYDRYMLHDENAVDDHIIVLTESKPNQSNKESVDASMIVITQNSLIQKTPNAAGIDDTTYPEDIKLEMKGQFKRNKKDQLPKINNLDAIFNKTSKFSSKIGRNKNTSSKDYIDINEIDITFHNDDSITQQSQQESHRMLNAHQHRIDIQNLDNYSHEIALDRDRALTARTSIAKVYPLESFRSSNGKTIIPSRFKHEYEDREHQNRGNISGRDNITSRNETESPRNQDNYIVRKSEPSSVRSHNSTLRESQLKDIADEGQEEEKQIEPILEDEYPQHLTPSSIDFESIDPIDEANDKVIDAKRILKSKGHHILAETFNNKNPFKVALFETNQRMKRHPVSLLVMDPNIVVKSVEEKKSILRKDDRHDTE